MRVKLFQFQERALSGLLRRSRMAQRSFEEECVQQVITFTAPTGAGKTIIMGAYFEAVFFGNGGEFAQPDVTFLWLSDSPELNVQSKDKLVAKADKLKMSQLVMVTDESFDQETFNSGCIYFLNTQKLGENSNLTKHSDERTYTIWETIRNTVEKRKHKFVLVIDEAHRGTQGRAATEATTIMQRFIKGFRSNGNRIEPMPIVIGVTATPDRFNRMVEGTDATRLSVTVTVEEVRSSGLLKDRIVLVHSDDSAYDNDMAVFELAARDWKKKCDHWYQYCYEQHYAQVCPAFVIQVKNRSDISVSSTDIAECLRTLERCTGTALNYGEVVHCFGEKNTLEVNGLKIPYAEPSSIEDDTNIKVIFFKDSLSTGWDCPRAETMMSFRTATDATYVAQLLGRMVRTPRHMRVKVDEYLNETYLFLPNFDADTINEFKQAYHHSSDIPVDVDVQAPDDTGGELLTVHTNISRAAGGHVLPPTRIREDSSEGRPVYTPSHSVSDSNQTTLWNGGENEAGEDENCVAVRPSTPVIPACNTPGEDADPQAGCLLNKEKREEILAAINSYGLLSYRVRRVRTKNYLKSLCELANLLTGSGISIYAQKNVREDVTSRISEFADNLRANGTYEERANAILKVKLLTQVIDSFGTTINETVERSTLLPATDTDVDKHFRRAETLLCKEGLGQYYKDRYYDLRDVNENKVDVILFVNDQNCMSTLEEYAKELFHKLADENRLKFLDVKEDIKNNYNAIVANGDSVSKHNFELPENVRLPGSQNGNACADHLFVDERTGMTSIELNLWEQGILEEERKKDDYVCWIRNKDRKQWALCIPYEMDGETKAMYPDFLTVHKSADGYIVDILETHTGSLNDNLPKAKGLAAYAQKCKDLNLRIGSVQLIRKSGDTFKRLDMTKTEVYQQVKRASTNAELDHIFEAL